MQALRLIVIAVPQGAQTMASMVWVPSKTEAYVVAQVVSAGEKET